MMSCCLIDDLSKLEFGLVRNISRKEKNRLSTYFKLTYLRADSAINCLLHFKVDYKSYNLNAYLLTKYTLNSGFKIVKCTFTRRKRIIQ